MQAVAVGHEALEDVCALAVCGSASIDLSVEVKLCKEELGSTLAGAACGSALGRESAVVYKVLELILKPCIEVCPLDLVRIHAHDCGFIGKGNVSEVVYCMIVCNGAEETGLVYHLLLGVKFHGRILSLADELVCHAHLHEDTGIESVDEAVVRSPVQVVEVLDGLVVPAADRLIGGEF